MSKIRLQKFIADCGVTSRRKAEELIAQGKVEVNGYPMMILGTKIDPAEDVVTIDGQVLDLNFVSKVYVLMNKPRGYVTTASDPEGRKTVMDLCLDISERIYPVGRLDYLSEGLLLLTNDGEIANMIMHPSFEVTKVYEVKVFGAVSDTILRNLRAGVQTKEGFLKPLSVRVVRQLPSKTWLEFRLGEGKNREIRRICEAFGLTVDKLKRVAIAGLTIDGMAPGRYRTINKRQLLDGLGMNEDGTKNEKINTDFVSSRKSISLKKKGFQNATMADDRTFRKFRKEEYFDTLKAIDETKRMVEEKKPKDIKSLKEAKALREIQNSKTSKKVDPSQRSDRRYSKYRKRR